MSLWTPESIAKAKSLSVEGKSHSQIATALGGGVTREAVGSLLRRQRLAVTPGCYAGENLADPNRADRLLRRFSWEERA